MAEAEDFHWEEKLVRELSKLRIYGDETSLDGVYCT